MSSLHPHTFLVAPGGRLHGSVRVPGDKSISHRAIMLGAIAEGTTHIAGFLEGEDSLATLNAFRQMGVHIEGPHQGRVTVQGVGLHGLQAPSAPLNLGNSGTSMRLLAGLLAGQAFDVVMTGDDSLSRRPMRRVTEPLRQMGARIDTTEKGTPPLHIHGGTRLKAIDYAMPMASAQVKSCLLLAGLYAQDGLTTCVTEPAPTRDHTERMLKGFGYPVTNKSGKACVSSGHRLTATAIDVPADISSAAFFMVGASIAEGSDLTLEHVGINPTRTGVINILRLMGANIEILREREIGGEPVADIRVRASRLRGVVIPRDQVPLAIDEFPALFIAAACAEGETVLAGAEELRVKESDRIQVMADGLLALGVDARPTPDGMIIRGGGLSGGRINSHGDHRIAMAFAMAALRANDPISIDDCANVATSFPGFIALARDAGLDISAVIDVTGVEHSFLTPGSV
jgi:3-phosphoshikimate 1-carboxyvinyltransferase